VIVGERKTSGLRVGQGVLSNGSGFFNNKEVCYGY